MKKLSVLLAVVMLLCALPFSVNAATPTVAVTSASANAGDEITVTVSLKDNPGIVGAQIYLSYNSDIMSFVSATAKDSRFATTFSPEQGANPVKIIMANLSLTEIAGDITAADVVFKLSGMANAGTHDMGVSMVEAYNKELAPVAFASENGTVTVKSTPSSAGGGSSHKHSYTKTVVPPTATEEGYTLNTCACGYSYKSDFTYGEAETKTEVKLTIGSPIAYINGVAQTLDAAPINRNNRTMLPVRFLANAFGVSNDGIAWDGATRTATLKNATTEIIITIGAPSMTVNGETVALDSPALIEHDRTYLPVRAIANALGVSNDNISWDEKTNTATLVK
ncbi:MAG: hypothetical protein IJU41_02500 [Clostridia bacterium]|nr:hypothetical protein [Clostridia bacterium]